MRCSSVTLITIITSLDAAFDLVPVQPFSQPRAPTLNFIDSHLQSNVNFIVSSKFM